MRIQNIPKFLIISTLNLKKKACFSNLTEENENHAVVLASSGDDSSDPSMFFKDSG